MRHFFDPQINEQLETYVLSPEESKHVVRVLRMSVGDQLFLLNGNGKLFTCTIEIPDQKACVLRINKVEESAKDPYHIHIALAPTKQLERIEWFVEKATELGVHEITFLATDNSERVNAKMDRFQKKAISALKQSQRLHLPHITETVLSFKEFVQKNPNGLIAHCYDQPKQDFNSSFKAESCPVIIGPEGDFSLKEIALAEQYAYTPISLGKTRLRTETAALYATSLAKHYCESL